MQKLFASSYFETQEKLNFELQQENYRKELEEAKARNKLIKTNIIKWLEKFDGLRKPRLSVFRL